MAECPLIGRGRTAEILAWDDHHVLKLFNAGFPIEWIQAEVQATRIAHKANLSVPAVGDLVKVDGRVGIIYERVDGMSMLHAFATRPWTFLSAVRQFVALHVAMHTCVQPELPSQRERLRHVIQEAPGLTVEVKERAQRRLEQLPDGDVICHGDYHPDNILMSAQGPVVIDWMTATRGNPLADVARTLLMCRLGSTPPGAGCLVRGATRLGQGVFHKVYLWEYVRHRPFPRERLEAWIPVLAAARLAEHIPEEEARLIALVETSLSG